MTYLEECAAAPRSPIEIATVVESNGYALERYRVAAPETLVPTSWHYRISYRGQHLATLAEESALRFANFIKSEQEKK